MASLHFSVLLLKSTAAGVFRLKSIARGARLLRPWAFRSEEHSRAREAGSDAEFAVQWSHSSYPRAGRSLPDSRKQFPTLPHRFGSWSAVRLRLALLFVRQEYAVVRVAVSRPIHTHVF